jgi:hypothetical protein
MIVTILGQDYRVEVTHYLHHPPFKGSAYQCDSSDDYYGFTEFEFDIFDDEGVDRYELHQHITPQEYDRLLKEYQRSLANDWE